MPSHSSSRSYPLRSRAASCVASFDAPSAAARSALSVAASYYSPLEQLSADRQQHAEEVAGKAREGAVVGGGMDGGEVDSTDSGVRVGLRVHSVRSSVGPAQRSVSDTAPHSAKHTTGTTRHITIIESVCTPQACSHCCQCHLRHNNNGYGRCMKSASAPWPDCECIGKCAAGRCAQPECASNHVVVVDLTASQPDLGSQSTTTPQATHSQQQQQQQKQQQQQQHDDDRHQPGVSAVSQCLTPPLR